MLEMANEGGATSKHRGCGVELSRTPTEFEAGLADPLLDSLRGPERQQAARWHLAGTSRLQAVHDNCCRGAVCDSAPYSCDFSGRSCEIVGRRLEESVAQTPVDWCARRIDRGLAEMDGRNEMIREGRVVEADGGDGSVDRFAYRLPSLFVGPPAV